MKTWLLTIARRLWIDHVRRMARRGESVALACDPPDTAAISDPVADAEQSELLNLAIAKLSETQRSAVVLFYQQQMNIEQVAAVMQLPAGTIKSHLYRALAKLRQLLEPQQEMLQP